MKQQLLTIFSLLIAISAAAQKADSARAIVHYKFSHVRDTNARDKPYTENMVLVAGQSASVYKSYDRKMQMAAMKQQAMEQMNNGTGQIRLTSRGTSTQSEYFLFPNEGKMVRKEKMMTTYLIDEPYPTINWKISSDTLTIKGLACQKATGHFKGRDYTAWFCADLPYRTGPWKLSGLPGLIVDAYDTRKDIVFAFDGIEQVVKTSKTAGEPALPSSPNVRIVMNGADDIGDDNNLVALPDNGVKTSVKEYENLREAMRKDPEAFMKAQMGGNGMPVRANATGGLTQVSSFSRTSGGSAPVNNNPIELPEKK